MSEFLRKYGVYIGAAFTALTVASLVYLHLFARPVVPRFAEPSADSPDLVRCDGEVTYVDDIARRVIDFWAAHDRRIGAYRVERCGRTCDWRDEASGDLRRVPCDPEHIVVALQDRWLDEEHAGQTVWVKNKGTGRLEWATILLPATIDGTSSAGGTRVMPPDAAALILAHEVGHWFGLDHVRTPFVGPLHSVPTGHILNPSAFELGWDADGVEP